MEHQTRSIGPQLAALLVLLVATLILYVSRGLTHLLVPLRVADPTRAGLVTGAYFLGFGLGAFYGGAVIRRVGHIRAFGGLLSAIICTVLVAATVRSPECLAGRPIRAWRLPGGRGGPGGGILARRGLGCVHPRAGARRLYAGGQRGAGARAAVARALPPRGLGSLHPGRAAACGIGDSRSLLVRPGSGGAGSAPRQLQARLPGLARQPGGNLHGRTEQWFLYRPGTALPAGLGLNSGQLGLAMAGLYSGWISGELPRLPPGRQGRYRIIAQSTPELFELEANTVPATEWPGKGGKRPDGTAA